MVGVLLKEGSPATPTETAEELKADLKIKCAVFPPELWQLVNNRITLDMEVGKNGQTPPSATPELAETQIFLSPDGRILKEDIPSYSSNGINENHDKPLPEVSPKEYQRLYPLALRKLKILEYPNTAI